MGNNFYTSHIPDVKILGTSLAVQCLRLRASTAGGTGLTLCLGPCMLRGSAKRKKKKKGKYQFYTNSSRKLKRMKHLRIYSQGTIDIFNIL